MPADGKQLVGDVVEILNTQRVPLSKAEREMRPGQFPYFGATGVLDYVDAFRFEGLHVLVGEDGTVVDSRGRPVLQLVSGKFWVSNHAHVARGSNDADTRFIYYALSNSKVQPFVTGSAQPKLSLGNFRSIPINWPGVAERNAIVGVLGALDDKIESNRRVAETAEMLGRIELEHSLAGSSSVGWQFAWPEQQLGSLLDVIETGRRPKGGVAKYSHGIPSVGAESIVSAGKFDFAKTKYIPQEFFESMSSGVLQHGDVLLYKDGGTPGNFIPHVSMTQDGFPFAEAAINEHVYRLRIRAPFTQAYLYYWLGTQRLLNEMWLRGTGAAIPSLNSSNVKELPIAVPDAETLSAVLPRVDDLISKVFSAAKESRSLELLRDALLPELLSGRLRVRDAEKFLEDEL